MRVGVIASWALVVTACGFDPRGVDLPGLDASSVDAAADAMPGPDAACEPTCMDSNTILECLGPSTVPTPRACAHQCSTTNGAHCRQQVPSNGATLADLGRVTSGLTTSSAVSTDPSVREYTIDTDTGEILDYGDDGYPDGIPQTIRRAGPDVVDGIAFRAISATVSVLAVDSVQIADGSVVYGFGDRALILLSRGAVVIQGSLDLSAGCYRGASGAFDHGCGGPGGGDGATNLAAATGCAPGGPGTALVNHTGGGGGGGGGRGANGGDASGGAKGGVATAIGSCASATLVPLIGGAGGGVGGAGTGGIGGGGGGAIQITSLTSISIPTGALFANIYAAGEGGDGPDLIADTGGGGGGGGGSILLEAPTLSLVTGFVTANGGGGGGGRLVSAASHGDPGRMSIDRAAGGLGDGPTSDDGRGGDGGARAGAPTDGAKNVDGTGAGGGGKGAIRFNADVMSAGGNTVVSPAPGPLGAIVYN